MDNLTVFEDQITKESIEARLQQTPGLLSSAETAANRLVVCSKCEYKTKKIGFDACSFCHCFLEFKTRYYTATCPMNYW
jgi:hypothetical protein